MLATNLVSQADTPTHADADVARLAPLFYHVGMGDHIAAMPPPPALA